MKLLDFLRPEAVLADIAGDTAQAVLAELCRPVAQACRLEDWRLLQVLLEREKLGSTGIGDGVAIPHGRVPGLVQIAASFGRSRRGVDFKSLDGRPTQLFFALFSPDNTAGLHLKVLARVSRLFRNAAFRQAILEALDAAAIWRLIQQEDQKD